MTIDEESVAGWLSPGEGALRFPVQLRESERLSLRLGATSQEGAESGSLTAIVEFTPVGGSARQLYRVDIGPDSGFFSKWVDIDVDLGDMAPGNGELRFEIEGSLAGDPDIKVLWGQPAVYYAGRIDHKHVLLIGVDTLRRDPLMMYGGNPLITPRIGRLSREATTFTRAWSQAPWTVPSFASMITGRYPADISPTLATDQLPNSAETLGEMLLAEDFATMTICGNAYLGNENSGFQQGMESLWYRLSATPSDSVEKAKEFIDRSDGRDWFLFLHFMDPHGPYDPPEEYIDKLCDPTYSGEYRSSFEDGLEWQLATERPSDEDIERVRCLYDAEVADLDQAIGDLLLYLRQKDIHDDTLVILAADHGEEFFEHGEFEHGQSLYEEMVHLPLVVWGREFTPGMMLDTPVANLDIAPTILSFLGEPYSDLPGVPLQEVASGNASRNRIILGEGNLRRSSHRKFAVQWPYKCILDFFTGETWLYDLENDPDELHDVDEQFPTLTEQLAREMILKMPPSQTMFAISMLGYPEGGPRWFSGTIKVPAGVGAAIDSGFLDTDDFSIDGETINFRFSSETTVEDPIKALIIVPAPGGDTIEVSLLSDGMVQPDRFYPYASAEAATGGSATVRVYDLPWPAQLPPDAMERPVACYIIGIPGFPRGEETGFEHRELDPQTLEELRALGYIN